MTLVSYARNLEVLYETPKDIPVDFPVDRKEIRARYRRPADGDRGRPVRNPVEGDPLGLRHSGHPPGPRGHRGGSRPRGRGRRLPGRPQGPVPGHHPQDRRRRRRPRPRGRRRGPGRIPDDDGRCGPQGPRRPHRRRHRAEDGPAPGRRRDDPGRQEGPDLRHRRHGRHGRHRRGDLPGQIHRLSPSQRAAGPPHARRAPDEAPPRGLPGTAPGRRRQARRDAGAAVLPGRRSPGGRRARHQSPARDARRRPGPRRPDRRGQERRRGPAAALRASVPAALSRGVRPAASSCGTARSSRSARSSPRTSRCGWPCSPAVPGNRSIPGSAISSSGSRTTWPAATATSTTTGSWPSSPRPARGPTGSSSGSGRLIAEPGRPQAEYAVLVQDAWQDKGLGGVLTDYCTGIARQWGIRTLTAITTTDNPRMIAVFEKRGFRIVNDLESSLVEVSKELL